jgi:hypothetical protein
MTVTRGILSNLIAPGFRKVVFETYKEKPIEGAKLVNMNTSKRAYEEDFPIAGFGTLQQKAEGGSISYQDPVQGSIKRYTWTTYALGFRITEEMYDDDLYGITGGKMSKALGRSARNNKEIVMAAPFNNGFSTSYPGFVSGESLFSTSHALIRGGTASNRPATDADFGLLALQAAVEHFHNLTDEAGIPMMMTPKLLWHSVGDHWLVNQILKSANLPGSNANDINQMAKEGLQPHLGHYFTDTDAWGVQADQHDVNYFERKPFTFKNTDDFDTGDAKFKGTRRNGSGWGDWRGNYASNGA